MSWTLLELLLETAILASYPVIDVEESGLEDMLAGLVKDLNINTTS